MKAQSPAVTTALSKIERWMSECQLRAAPNRRPQARVPGEWVDGGECTAYHTIGGDIRQRWSFSTELEGDVGRCIGGRADGSTRATRVLCVRKIKVCSAATTKTGDEGTAANKKKHLRNTGPSDIA